MAEDKNYTNNTERPREDEEMCIRDREVVVPVVFAALPVVRLNGG